MSARATVLPLILSLGLGCGDAVQTDAELAACLEGAFATTFDLEGNECRCDVMATSECGRPGCTELEVIAFRESVRYAARIRYTLGSERTFSSIGFVRTSARSVSEGELLDGAPVFSELACDAEMYLAVREPEGVQGGARLRPNLSVALLANAEDGVRWTAVPY